MISITSNRITLAGFTYDAAGNEMSDVTNSYVWNAESEIKTAGGLNYSYDGDGDRVQKSNGKICNQRPPLNPNGRNNETPDRYANGANYLANVANCVAVIRNWPSKEPN